MPAYSRFDDVPRCYHVFNGGLCENCLCPETEQDNQRASIALYNAMGLEGTWFDEWKRFLTKGDAILLAWRLNHKKGKV